MSRARLTCAACGLPRWEGEACRHCAHLAAARADGFRAGVEAAAGECDRLFWRGPLYDESAEYRAGWECGLESAEDAIRALPLPEVPGA